MAEKNDKLFEKLDDGTLYNVSGGLEINKPLNTVVVSNEKSVENDTNNRQLHVPEKKLPSEPFKGLNKGLIK